MLIKLSEDTDAGITSYFNSQKDDVSLFKHGTSFTVYFGANGIDFNSKAEAEAKIKEINKLLKGQN